MDNEEYRLSEAVLKGLDEVPPMKALTTLCIAAGRMTASVERFVGEDLLMDVFKLIGEVRDAHQDTAELP